MNKEITKSKDWRQFWNLEGFRLSGVIDTYLEKEIGIMGVYRQCGIRL
jgi:hypothetical protein